MPSKSVQSMSIRCGNQWFLESARDPARSSVGIKRPLVKMAELDAVEAIDLID